ncbi:MAG TPA: endonuclease [Streptosporangiaceae bacterium]|nr:endonuclease [Streptosporangiaceae bacterium]
MADALVPALLREAGQTYAEEAGIKLKDQPAPLFRLLVLANLLSTRINASIAVAAARELFAAGGGTAAGMTGLSWQDRVDALGRGHYVRYDESTSTRLGRMAQQVIDDYGGDLRKLAKQADGDAGRLRELLRRFPGVGPTGADIFCREVQGVWPWLAPYLDKVTIDGARRVGLPVSAKRLADRVERRELGRFAAALTRVARDKKLADKVTAAAA